MNISAIFRLMGGDGEELFKAVREETRENKIAEGAKQYNPELHDVASKSKRPDKRILEPSPSEVDQITGEPKMVEGTAKVARVPLSLQKYIIKQKAAFARGNGVILSPSASGSALFDYVKRNWDKNKSDYFLGEIARRQMAETQVAVIFYSSETPKSKEDFRLRFKIVSPSKGDKLKPIFDSDTDDLIAFSREYEVGKETWLDVYVMNAAGFCEIHHYVNPSIGLGVKNKSWIERKPTTITPYTSLPIVYWEQDEPECNDTKELMKEFEEGFSDFLTQMGYSADPILFGSGDAFTMPAKGSPGKFITGKDGADLKYVTPENATESRDLQFKMLQKFIFTLNRAVLLDLETMKGLGAASGIALERYLIDAYMEATDRQQGSWGLGVQRMVNFMLSTWKTIVSEDLSIEVKFTKYTIEDVLEKITIAMKANGGLPVIDHKGSIEMAGLTEDTDKTYTEIQGQTTQPNTN